MSAKDPFQILADELTLIRKDMDRLQRTSLDKDEAQALHQIVAEAVADMRKATRETPQALQSALKADRDRMAQKATESATEAAERALGEIRAQLSQERQRLTQAAGEARREAWRYFGGFWVWLAAMLATGVILGLVIAYGMETAKSAFSVDDLVRYNCGRSWFGGQVVEQENGSSFCAFWLIRPDQ
ncbi:hypothetical protein SAMN05421538_1251 [Paracoccus isoporae]|uniref:Uncharacterized protein n=1 Tax=Paracoccus isoporae TaxID=591205 RepID=A0A1G7HLF5_9RHOB|nr:hypothetical protein [Paracoccus isoporae]SDF01265.1 hypothetical protein SAMN05421538_1251 [Paracoccus isoporae]